MDVVLADIDRRARAVPSLWTQLSFSATFVNPENQQSDSASGDGGLMFRAPRSLTMTGDKDIAGRVFELGGNNTEFWVKLRTGGNAWNYWWGHYANLGKPCCRPIPIRPDLVVQVLGVSVVGNDFLSQPVPVMRYDPENDAYVFDFNVRTPDRWVTEKEIWYDAGTKLPTRVLLFDGIGRPVVSAILSDPTPAEVPGVPAADWPTVARHYELAFPDTGSQMSITFDAPAVTHVGRHDSVLPNDRSFDRPDPDDNNKVIQIDKDCPDSPNSTP